jgi:hypothetical protein
MFLFGEDSRAVFDRSRVAYVISADTGGRPQVPLQTHTDNVDLMR